MPPTHPLALTQRLATKARRVTRTARGRWVGMRRGVTVGRGTQIGPRARIEVEGRDARITLGALAYLEEGVVLAVAASGHIEIGSTVFIGHHSTIMARESVSIGDGCALAEHVSIRDHDHVVGRPPGEGGLVVTPVAIGAGTWIAAKASVLRGVRIGSVAVIGAHAVVRSDVPDNAIAVGVPARVLEK